MRLEVEARALEVSDMLLDGALSATCGEKEPSQQQAAGGARCWLGGR